MNSALYICRKNYLNSLIKRVSEGFGGDIPEFLRTHQNEVILAHPGDKIEDAIACYEQMCKQIKYYEVKDELKATNTEGVARASVPCRMARPSSTT